MNKLYHFYCLSFNNPIRTTAMREKFATLGEYHSSIYEGVHPTNQRISEKKGSDSEKRVWSCMWGHLDMINDFYYNSSAQFGIFCEDDILIHKDIIQLLPKILNDFTKMKLDVLLLGYLLPFTLDNNNNTNNSYFVDYNNSFKYNSVKYNYYTYPNDLWGTQMYVLSKSSAKHILDKYYVERGDNDDLPFSSDWTITKYGKRAMIYPMIAIEQCPTPSSSLTEQDKFHLKCHTTHFDEIIFI